MIMDILRNRTDIAGYLNSYIVWSKAESMEIPAENGTVIRKILKTTVAVSLLVAEAPFIYKSIIKSLRKKRIADNIIPEHINNKKAWLYLFWTNSADSVDFSF